VLGDFAALVAILGVSLLLLVVFRLRNEIAELRTRIAALEPPPLPLGSIASKPDQITPPPASDEDEIETLEGRIGGKLLLYAGMIVLVLGVAFFLRYAFEHAWMSPVVRVALGVLAGSFLTVFGYRLAVGYRAYGLFVCGGGIALLYLSIYAAVSLYGVLPQVPGFIVLVAITTIGAALADRTASQPLALMAVCGGFLVPFLVGGDRDAQLTLFGYDALLVA
jgi:uncharacterized membrane protein